MIETYLQTLATVLGSMEEAKKNMYAFTTTTYTGFQCIVDKATSEKFKGNLPSTTTYTGFQCIVDKATSEKFKGLPGVVWVLPDSYIDMKNKDYGVLKPRVKGMRMGDVDLLNGNGLDKSQSRPLNEAVGDFGLEVDALLGVVMHHPYSVFEVQLNFKKPLRSLPTQVEPILHI